MKIICPVCKAKVKSSEISQINRLLPFDGSVRKPKQSYEESLVTILSRFPSYYQWACDDCISSKKAILANPKKQFYTFKYPWDVAVPYLSYYDKEFTCKNCGDDFLFSKEEQQYWYEELSFVVYSKPNHCKTCRAEIRKSKNLNKELSDLLRDGTPQEKEKLLRIAEIYQEMGKEEKVKMYLNAANKLN